MTPPLIILILSLLLGMQPLTSDLYLPALPALTDSLGTTLPRAQLSLTALLLAFGVSQLVWGPLSDRFGRRPVLLAGLTGYVLAALGSVLAGSIEALVLWRALQGAFMGAGTVCARAIVRDCFSPTEGARAMSKGLTGLGFSACLGPFAGGLIAMIFWNKGTGIVGPSQAAVFMNIMPLVGIICGVLFLDEQLLISQAIGGVLILGGVYLTTQYRTVAYRLAKYFTSRQRKRQPLR